MKMSRDKKSLARKTKFAPDREDIVAVLDIGSSKTTCLIARLLPAHPGYNEPSALARLMVVGCGYQRSTGIKSGVIINMDQAEHAIRAAVSEAEKQAGLMVEDIIVSVGCGRIGSENFLASDQLNRRAVNDHDIDRVILAGHDYAAREGRQVLHTIPICYTLDENNGIQNPRGMIGDHLAADIHAITADAAPIRNLSLAVERCHLNISGFVASPYASGLATVTDDEAKIGVACLDIGGGTTTLSVFAEGHFVFSDSIAMGGRHITHDIARALSTPLEEAERIKTLYGSAVTAGSDEQELIRVPKVGEEAVEYNQLTRSQLALLIRPRIEEILVVISDRLKKSGFSPYAGQQLVLTGGTSALSGLANYAGRLLGKSVRVGRPKSLTGLSDQAKGPDFSSAIGILLCPLQPYGMLEIGHKSRFLFTGTDYLSRVGQWFRQSF